MRENRNVKKLRSSNSTAATTGSVEHEPAFFSQWDDFCHLGNTYSSSAGQTHAQHRRTGHRLAWNGFWGVSHDESVWLSCRTLWQSACDGHRLDEPLSDVSPTGTRTNAPDPGGNPRPLWGE